MFHFGKGDNSQNSTFILTYFTKFLVAMNRQAPKWQQGMWGLNLSTKHPVWKIFLTAYSIIKYIFQICLEIKLNDHYYSENGCFM